MKIRIRVLLSLMVVLTLLGGACSREGSDKAGRGNGQDQAQGTAERGLVRLIKNGKLLNFQATSIGRAFDSYSYLVNKEWKEKQLKSGLLSVEFTGWFDPRSLDDKAAREGVTDRGLEITFVINPDGSYYLFTIVVLDKLSDGKMSRVRTLDSSAALQSIYANEKIAL